MSIEAGGVDAHGNNRVAFQPQAFCQFVALVGRLFYDDGCIVLLDYLAREQKGLVEADIRERLGWREGLVQQKLYQLEKHQLVVQDQGTRTKATAYWRINHRICAAVTYRLQQVVDRLSKLVADASMQHEFECSDCGKHYSTLDAASCERTLEDEHPLCDKCHAPLKPSEFEETKRQAKSKKAAAMAQLEPLRLALQRIAPMQVQPFHNHRKGSEEQESDTPSSTPQPPSAKPPSAAAPSNGSTLLSSTPLPSSSATSSTLHTSLASMPGTIEAAGLGSRVIPWFDSGRGSSHKRPVTAPTRTDKISFGLKVPPSAFIQPPSKKEPPCLLPLPLLPEVTEKATASEEPLVQVGELKVKLSEVTVQMEEAMTDSEYSAYYDLQTSSLKL